nr:MAG TPA: hypothetical protein [Bacteriophage sp.]
MICLFTKLNIAYLQVYCVRHQLSNCSLFLLMQPLMRWSDLSQVYYSQNICFGMTIELSNS